MKLIINAMRESYSKDDVQTMTVGELKAFLEDFDDDTRIILSHDRGYTYGGIRESLMEEDYEDEGGD